MRDSVDTIRILGTVEEQNSTDKCSEFFNDDAHLCTFSLFRQFLWKKFWGTRDYNYRTRSFREFAKFLRRKFHLTKEIKHEGYERYFTENERR